MDIVSIAINSVNIILNTRFNSFLNLIKSKIWSSATKQFFCDTHIQIKCKQKNIKRLLYMHYSTCIHGCRSAVNHILFLYFAGEFNNY